MQIISERNIHTRANWGLPTLLFVAQASRGRTVNTESVNAATGKAAWVPSPDSLCVAWKSLPPLSVSLRVNEHDDDDDDGTDIHTITSNSSDCMSLLCTVLCTGSFMYTAYTLSHLILTASLSSPFLS